MASGGDIHSILYRGDVLKQPVPRFDPTKNVQRYFPGQVPQFGHPASDSSSSDVSDEEFTDIHKDNTCIQAKRLKLLESVEADQAHPEAEQSQPEAQPPQRRRRRIEEPVVIVHNVHSEGGDERASQSIEPETSSNPGTLTKPTEEAPRQLNSDVLREERRQRILQLRKEEEQNLDQRIAESTALQREQESEDSGDNDDDEDDIDEDDTQAVRPVFIPASKRLLQKQSELTAQENAVRAQKFEELSNEERIQESKQLLAQTILQELEAERKQLEDATNDGCTIENMPDDRDNEDQELEYELWRIRELKRMLRDQKEEQQKQLEQERIERRRHMTPEELAKDDALLDAQQPKTEERKKYVYLQKYYHKGAFFQDLAAEGKEPLYMRDFNEPLAEDKVDKQTLPRPLQTRRGLFGKAGQVKHTHLTDVDTTDFTANWSRKNNPINRNIMSKLAGYKGADDLERPSQQKKR